MATRFKQVVQQGPTRHGRTSVSPQKGAVLFIFNTSLLLVAHLPLVKSKDRMRRLPRDRCWKQRAITYAKTNQYQLFAGIKTYLTSGVGGRHSRRRRRDGEPHHINPLGSTKCANVSCRSSGQIGRT
jgi:hypothetical protein